MSGGARIRSEARSPRAPAKRARFAAALRGLALQGALVAPVAVIPLVPVEAAKTARVHDEAVLESPRSSVAAGEALPLRGSDFGKQETYRLRLVGALAEYELGEVRSDSAGRFSLEVAIPSEARPGVYRVVAVAPDGDEAAKLDVTIVAASPEAAGGHEAAEGAGGHRATGGRSATAEEIRIERSRSGLEWGVIGLAVGFAAGLGLALLRSRTPA